MIRFKLTVILFLCLSLEVYPQVKEKLTFAAHWLPQAQFAGYYAAEHYNIYDKYGIDIEIVHAGPGITAEELLSDGSAKAASMFLSTALIQRSSGKDFINIGQLSQRCAQLFVAKKSSGILKPADIEGKNIGIWRSGFDEIPTAFLMHYNLNVEFTPIATSVTLFILDGIDIMTTMWYNEFHTILNSGLDESELTTFFFSDYDLDIPEDGIYCRNSEYKKNPDLYEKFVKATFEGWRLAFNRKEDALDLVLYEMGNANIPANRAHQAWMLNRMEDIFFEGDNNSSFGILTEDDYNKTVDVLMETAKIKSAPPYNEFFFGDIK